MNDGLRTGRTAVTTDTTSPKEPTTLLEELARRTGGAQGSSVRHRNREERTRSWDCHRDAVGQEQLAGILVGIPISLPWGEPRKSKSSQPAVPCPGAIPAEGRRRTAQVSQGRLLTHELYPQHVRLRLFHRLCATLHVFYTGIIKSFFSSPTRAFPVWCH